MVLFPKEITLIFLTTSPGKAGRSIKGNGKLSTKWLKPQMQTIRVEGLNLKHKLDFDKYLAFPGKCPSAEWASPAQLYLFNLLPKKRKGTRALLQLGQWSSRTQENQIQLQWMHAKITWACNCHKTVTSNHQPSAGDAKALAASPYPQKQTWIKAGQRGFISFTS